MITDENSDEQEIDLSCMKIFKIKNIFNFSLQKLDISNNQISKICNLSNLVTLQELNLSDNKISKIEGLDLLINLKVLNISENKITKIEGLDNLVKLQDLNLSCNNIDSIDGLNSLKNLTYLSLYNNKITSLKGLEKLINLQELCIFTNYISEIKYIEPLVNMQFLNLNSNNISSIPPTILLMQRLLYFYCWDNPIKIIPPYIQRFLDKIDVKKNIYKDPQNVHDSTIQLSIQKSIINILQTCNDGFDFDIVLFDEHIHEITKKLLVKYCSDESVHSELGITFKELFSHVWVRINNHIESLEMKKILNIEMLESDRKCFTGRLTRLVNCLSGFYDDVELKISDKSQINGIILAVKRRLETTGMYTINKHKEIATHELLELGYTIDVIEEYTFYI